MTAPSFLEMREDKDPKEVVREIGIRTPLREILNNVWGRQFSSGVALPRHIFGSRDNLIAKTSRVLLLWLAF
jgi:hypothetical protein